LDAQKKAIHAISLVLSLACSLSYAYIITVESAESIANASRERNCNSTLSSLRCLQDDDDVSKTKIFRFRLCVAISPLVEHVETKHILF